MKNEALPKLPFASFLDVLAYLHARGDTYEAAETDPVFYDPSVLDSIAKKLVNKRPLGGGWGYVEQLRITDEGRAIIGLPKSRPPASFIGKVRAAVSRITE